jgi:uncharacterized membrane protein SirB2
MLASHYLEIRALHVATVALSITLFVLRGALMLAGSRLLQGRLLRMAPHVVDTVLLVSAVLLTLIIHQYPLANGWLTAKLAGLVAYVILGSIAIRRGRTRRQRAAAFLAALVCVGYIVATALHHDPDPRHWVPAAAAR